MLVLFSGCSSSSDGGTEAREAEEVRALIAGSGRGAEEPRHVADALMQYRLLRSRGLSDAEIVLALPSWAISGPNGPPLVRSEVGGPNLREGAEIDMPVSALAPGRLAEQFDAGPGSLQAYVFVSGHGGREGLTLSARGKSLDGADLASALRSLRASREGKATMTVVVEGCRPDSFLDALEDEPGATVLSAAARGEASFATEYDRHSGAWLADEFTVALTDLVANGPPTSAAELLARLREEMHGSEPQLAGETDRSLAELVPG